MSEFYAHTAPGDPSNWEPLFTARCVALTGGKCEACERLDPKHGHLNKVAWWTATFTEQMFPAGSPEASAAREWGHLAGLWHDLGKFAPAWQTYLLSKSDIHRDEITGRIDHATAGAQHAAGTGNILGHLLAYSIAGHHSGLLDAISEKACLQKRFEKDISSYANAPQEILNRTIPDLPSSVARDIRNPFVAALFTRLIFSALVDADFLATEAFMNPAQAGARRKGDATLQHRMLELLEAHVAAFPVPANEVDRARADVHAACRAAAAQTPGLFSLTVPTGGGKTLSSLAFALRHAIKHGQQRVIYVIPFTSIIDQNAAVFEDVFKSMLGSDSDPVVLQHHSNLSPARKRRAHVSRRRIGMLRSWSRPRCSFTNHFTPLARRAAASCTISPTRSSFLMKRSVCRSSISARVWMCCENWLLATKPRSSSALPRNRRSIGAMIFPLVLKVFARSPRTHPSFMKLSSESN